MLSDAEVAVLDFEGTWLLRPGPKDVAIEFDLGMTACDYYETLLGLLARPEALRRDPLTMRRVKAVIEPVEDAQAVI